MHHMPCCANVIMHTAQQISKISDNLEEKKKKTVIELERKMRQRRLQRERTIMEIVSMYYSTLRATHTIIRCQLNNADSSR